MVKRKPTLVFLIRLWQVEEGGYSTWRASLESVSSGEKQVFANLDALDDFLREQIVQASLHPSIIQKKKA